MRTRPPGVAVVAVTPPLMNDLLARILTGMDIEVVRHPECLDEDGRLCRAWLLVTSDRVPPGVEVELVIRVAGDDDNVSLSLGDPSGSGVTHIEGRTLDEVVAAVRSHLGELPEDASAFD